MGFRLFENKKPSFNDIFRDVMVLFVILMFLGFIFLLIPPHGDSRVKRIKAEADISAMEIAIAMYQTDMEGYFGNYSGIIGDISSPDPLYIGLVSPNDILKAQPNFKHWYGPYIKNIPKDPWGEYYYYTNNKADIDGTNKQVGVPIGEQVPDSPYYLYSKGKD